MFEIRKPRCEYLKNPIGIDVEVPRISWQLYSDKRDVVQTAYQIQVAGDSAFENIIWDSEKVFSDQSIHIKIDEFNIVPCKRYYYRVCAWDQEDISTGWSEISFWETGLMNPNEWKAEWISAPKFLSHDEGGCPQFRYSFHIKKVIKEARVYVTSLGLYELKINGCRVGENYFTPGWTNYNTRLQYQTYDVTALLNTGENVIGSVLGNGWYTGNIGFNGGRQNIYGDRKALLLELHLMYGNGEKEVVKTDTDWKVANGPILMSEIYHGETYDARLEQQGWSSPGFEDDDWNQAESLSHPKHMILAQESQPVRKMEEIKPVGLVRTPNGEIVLDMGQNMVGWIRFTVKDHRGQKVCLKHAEVLDHEGNFYTGNLRAAKQTIEYILKGEGTETFEPRFTFQGFRYVQLIGFDEPLQLKDFKGIVLYSDMEKTGDFKCSDPQINQLQHNIVWGQKGNFLDVPTDCPQRDERLGWTGDAQMFISTAAFLRNVAPFFTKWLRDLKSEQAPDGGVPFVVPNVLGTEGTSEFPPPFSSAAWGDAAVICPWILYQNYGDVRILEEQYESMQAWVEYIRRQGDNEYLWNTGFHFGDWLALDSQPGSYIGATDRDYVATAFYAYSVSLLQKSAEALHKTEDVEKYANLHAKVVAAFQEEFITPSGRLAVPTQTSQVLALKFGLLDGVARDRAISKLIELLDESDDHLKTGFVGTPYLNFVLSEAGHNEKAYQLLFQTDYPSWLYQVKKGATTIWEHWDGIKEDGSFWSDDMNSFNHYAYGAIGDWLYRCVAGIDTDERQPGYKHIQIHPRPGSGLEWAQGQLESMYGMISSSWRKNDDESIDVKVTIPVNTTASVLLPRAKEKGLEESGTDIHAISGLHSIRQQNSGVALVLGSGEYHFVYEPDCYLHPQPKGVKVSEK